MKSAAGPVALTACALALLTLAAMGPVLSADFLNWDDPEYVTENPWVLPGLTAAGAAWAFTAFHSGNWHPLTWLSHMLDVEVFGLRPGGHHLTNLALHAANAVLLFFLLRGMTGALVRSALVAALFAVHPLHVQSVAWVAERKDVLSTLFGILAAGAYLHRARSPQPRSLLPVALLFALSLMAKPMLVTLPLALLLLDCWPLARLGHPFRAGPALALLGEKLPLLLLSGASAAVTLAAQHSGRTIVGLDAFPLASRAGNAFLSSLRYLDRTVFPRKLAVFYPHAGREFPVWLGFASLLGVAALTALALRASRRRGYPAAGWLLYLITLLPAIGLVQVGIQAMADRYTYLPLTGVFIVAAWAGGEAAADRPRLLPPLAACATIAVVALTLLCRREAGFWRDSVALADHSAASTGPNMVVLTIKGVTLSRAGRLDEAIPILREVARSNPGQPDLRYNLASALARRGDVEEAVAEYRAVLQLAPDDADAHLALGALLAGRDDAGAHRHLLTALALEPRSAAAHRELSRLQERLGGLAEALEHARRQVELSPLEPEAQFRLGLLLARQGRYAEALAAFERQMELAPPGADTLYNVGRIHDLRGERRLAAEAYRRSLNLDPASPQTQNSLGAVLMELGEREEATARFREALRLDPGNAEASANLLRAETARTGP